VKAQALQEATITGVIARTLSNEENRLAASPVPLLTGVKEWPG
jgi:hypothetical protein